MKHFEQNPLDMENKVQEEGQNVKDEWGTVYVRPQSKCNMFQIILDISNDI